MRIDRRPGVFPKGKIRLWGLSAQTVIFISSLPRLSSVRRSHAPVRVFCPSFLGHGKCEYITGIFILRINVHRISAVLNMNRLWLIWFIIFPQTFGLLQKCRRCCGLTGLRAPGILNLGEPKFKMLIGSSVRLTMEVGIHTLKV